MRLFVAINLPEAVRNALWRAAEPLRSRGYPVRWVEADALHVTVKFLGEVAPAREEEIAAALRAAVGDARAFTLPLGGFGAFPSATRPRVIWAGCEGVPPLELLAHRVERAMADLAFPLEGRPFRPHVTLGRARERAAQAKLAGLGEALDGLRYEGEAVVESLDLMESRLSPRGARYAARYVARLSA